MTEFDPSSGTSKGVLIGKDGNTSVYEIFAGQEDGHYIHWDGSNLNVSGNNLTNERGWHYISRSDQVHKLDSAGRLFTFGVNVRF